MGIETNDDLRDEAREAVVKDWQTKKLVAGEVPTREISMDDLVEVFDVTTGARMLIPLSDICGTGY